jgi:uncharacterized protein
LIAIIIFRGAGRLLTLAMRHFEGGSQRQIFSFFTPRGVAQGEARTFCAYLIAICIMSLIEGRRIRDYGIGLKGAFGWRFWLGAVTGFAAISLLLGTLKIAGVFHLGQAGLHGDAVSRYGLLWLLAFLLVGLQEEGTGRGYLLFTLSTGIGFWPSAILTSLLFGAIHLGNPGESHLGALSAGGIGLFFCIVLRKTGNLWPAIGFHMAWDWGETYFYGVPDSGLTATGHLFNATFAGPVWLTGGSVGPEASWFCLILIALLCVAASFLPGARFPDPESVPDPRRRGAEPASSLFPEAAQSS